MKSWSEAKKVAQKKRWNQNNSEFAAFHYRRNKQRSESAQYVTYKKKEGKVYNVASSSSMPRGEISRRGGEILHPTSWVSRSRVVICFSLQCNFVLHRSSVTDVSDMIPQPHSKLSPISDLHHAFWGFRKNTFCIHYVATERLIYVNFVCLF